MFQLTNTALANSTNTALAKQTSTPIAKETNTVKSYSTATAAAIATIDSLVSSLDSGATKAYGPITGQLEPDNAFRAILPSFQLKNFIIEVSFLNPDNTNTWNYGIELFSNGTSYLVLVSSSKAWQIGNTSLIAPSVGKVNNLDIDPKGLNTIRIYRQNSTIILYVNGVFTTKQSYAISNSDIDSVKISQGYYSTADDYSTEYKGLTIWGIP